MSPGEVLNQIKDETDPSYHVFNNLFLYIGIDIIKGIGFEEHSKTIFSCVFRAIACSCAGDINLQRRHGRSL